MTEWANRDEWLDRVRALPPAEQDRVVREIRSALTALDAGRIGKRRSREQRFRERFVNGFYEGLGICVAIVILILLSKVF